MEPRFDFVFSYWLYIWVILYMIGLIPFNPKLFLILGVIVNIIFYIFLLPRNKVVYFLIINTFMKVISIYITWNTKIKSSDNYFGIGLLFFYLLWMKINNESITKLRMPMTDYLKKHNIHMI